MSPLTLQAPAKINLTLDILGTRPDGYHEMDMVMQSVSLCDEITLDLGSPGGIRAESGLRFLPNDKGNLAVAAAVLRGLNDLTGAGLDREALARIGQEVGSDVPYCVLGGTALARGRGEILTPLPSLPPCHIVLCKPAFSISTPALFRAWDKKKRRLRPDTNGMLEALAQGDLVGVGRRMFNVFEGVLNPQQRREIESIKNALIQAGALGAAMSGSGPTVLGLFDREDLAGEAVRQLRKTYDEVFLTQPV